LESASGTNSRNLRAMDPSQWNERYATSELVWSGEPNLFVREVLGAVTPGRILDLACGEGRNAIWLAENGWKATGADFSQVGIDKAAALSAQRGVDVHWICSDATQDRINDTFDYVLVCYLQLSRDDLRAALTLALDTLEPGGRILIIAHARDNLTEGVGGPQDPAVLMSADEVVALLHNIEPEMKILRADQPVRMVSGPDPSAPPRSAIDLVVHAERGTR
jgi:SAM-dependent methyltransferase